MPVAIVPKDGPPTLLENTARLLSLANWGDMLAAELEG